MSADFGPWHEDASAKHPYWSRSWLAPNSYRPRFYVISTPTYGIEVQVEGRAIGHIAQVRNCHSFEDARKVADAIGRLGYGYTLSDESETKGRET